MIKNIYLYFILIITFIYTYLYVDFEFPIFFIELFEHPVFKISFLLGLYLFGNDNIPLTIFMVINYIGLSVKIDSNIYSSKKKIVI
jgi:hypothetical protein